MSTLRISTKFYADLQLFSQQTDIFSHHRDIFANRNFQITFCNCRVLKNVLAFECSTIVRAYFATGFFKENIRYPVWTCRDPISLILGTRFSMILGTRFSILGIRIGKGPEFSKTTSAITTLFRRSRQNSYLLPAFQFGDNDIGIIVTSPIATLFVSPCTIFCSFTMTAATFRYSLNVS